MLGELPTRLEVDGKEYPIDSDFRNVLAILSAFNDEELDPSEKGYICLKRLYDNFEEIPQDAIQEAYIKAVKFINFMSDADDGKKRKFIDWDKDEQLIFPAINAAAGTEVRLVPYMHWWTFIGYFQNVNPESLFGTVLTIRQKRAKGKKLEKWEREFERNNRELCALPAEHISVEDKIKDLFDSLPEEE